MPWWNPQPSILGKAVDHDARYVVIAPEVDHPLGLSLHTLGNGYYEDVGTMVTTHPHMNAYWEDKNPNITNIEVPMYVLMSYSTGLHTEGSFRGWKYASSKDKW